SRTCRGTTHDTRHRERCQPSDARVKIGCRYRDDVDVFTVRAANNSHLMVSTVSATIIGFGQLMGSSCATLAASSCAVTVTARALDCGIPQAVLSSGILMATLPSLPGCKLPHKNSVTLLGSLGWPSTSSQACLERSSASFCVS